MKKSVCVWMASLLALPMASIPANAGFYDGAAEYAITAASVPSKTWGETSDGHTFSKEWEVTKNLYIKDVSSPVGCMKYGYDTNFINEDYCSCYFVDHSAQAAISQSGFKSKEGSQSNPGTWSKVEIKHKNGSKVSYYAKSYGKW